MSHIFSIVLITFVRYRNLKKKSCHVSYPRLRRPYSSGKSIHSDRKAGEVGHGHITRGDHIAEEELQRGG